MPRLLLVDDHPLVEVAIEAALQRSGRDWQLHSVEDDQAAMANLASCQYQLVVLDIGLPQVDGLQLLKRILRHYPAQSVLIYTAQEEEVYARLAFAGGASGFINKGQSMSILVEALEALSRGETVFPAWLDQDAETDNDDASGSLTPKELQIIGLLAQGHSNLQIANMLNISNKTVSTHKKNILRKTGANNLFELAAVYKELQKP
ncbi:response regulator transcription factor [Serratia sp. M24T3]|uniref:Response regulator n=1 Tax=Rouxiella sp. WC2420 TaxID=3234145 RepID=A0AB39VPJ5_9GAMM|nr:response regulator transcription factor [Serratia sp. M24T3]EIC82567.1 LuxR family transcriptional regulator [Serratia sp. M24T3]